MSADVATAVDLPLPDVTNGCTAKCCVMFTLPWPMDRFREHRHRVADGEQIYAMVIPLDRGAAIARAERFGVDADPDANQYACRNWDEDTGQCKIYDERPAMCRDYPYGEPCSHDPKRCRCAGTPRAKQHAERELKALSDLFRTRPLTAFPRPPATVGPR